MIKIRKGRALERSLQQFPDDPYINYCKMHGPIHYSYCVYCPDYTGKEQVGDRFDRKTSHCLLKSTAHFGRAEDGCLVFEDQSYIDARINADLPDEDGLRRSISVPLDENDIKSAFNNDVPSWDWMRHSFYFCFRCGPDQTGEIHFRCQRCRDHDICSNCAVDTVETREPDGSRTLRFNCPACHQPNEFNLGKGDVYAGRFTDRRPERRLRWVKESFLPVFFDWIDILLRGEFAALTSVDDHVAKPSPPAKAVRISSGWLRGLYWIDEVSRKAWRDMPGGDWKGHLFGRAPEGLALANFDYDLVLSYRTEDLEAARSVLRMLSAEGYSVFLMEAGRNVWDQHWPLRFSQAICRSRHLAILATPVFLEGDATKLELDELRLQSALRRRLAGTHSPVYAIALEKSGSAFISDDHVTMCSPAEMLAVLRDSQDDIPGYFRPHVIEPTPFAFDPDDPRCPTCLGPVSFSQEKVYWPDEPKIKQVYEARPALTCVNGHRFCMGCDAGNFGGGRDCCPICFRQNLGANPNVAGRRTPWAIYYSGIKVFSLYWSFDPQNPKCLNCEQPLTEEVHGLSCLHGHRYCTACVPEGDGRCQQCSVENPGILSKGIRVPNSAYFLFGRDIRPNFFDDD